MSCGDARAARSPTGSRFPRSSLDDRLDGYRGGDVLRGGAGQDTLSVLRGLTHDRSQLWGEEGDDVLLGGRGQETLRGGAGNDDLHGGPGFDVADGGLGRDRCYDVEDALECERG